MRSLEELKKMPHLSITCRARRYGLDQFHVYDGFVSWHDFEGTVVFGYDEGECMEHVSVSSRKRKQLPTWEQMQRLKDLFFYPEEMVLQIHPPESKYVHGVNGLNNVLHLWRPMDGDFSILNSPERWM